MLSALRSPFRLEGWRWATFLKPVTSGSAVRRVLSSLRLLWKPDRLSPCRRQDHFGLVLVRYLVRGSIRLKAHRPSRTLRGLPGSCLKAAGRNGLT